MADIGITSNITHTPPVERTGDKSRQNKDSAKQRKNRKKANPQDKLDLSTKAGITDTDASLTKMQRKEHEEYEVGDLIDIKA